MSDKPLRWVIKESDEGYAWAYCPVCGYKATGPEAWSGRCPRCDQQLDKPETENKEAI